MLLASIDFGDKSQRAEIVLRFTSDIVLKNAVKLTPAAFKIFCGTACRKI